MLYLPGMNKSIRNYGHWKQVWHAVLEKMLAVLTCWSTPPRGAVLGRAWGCQAASAARWRQHGKALL